MAYLAQSHMRVKVLYYGITPLGELESRNTTVWHFYFHITTTTTVVIWIKSPILFLLLLLTGNIVT